MGETPLYKATKEENAMMKMAISNINELQSNIQELTKALDIQQKYLSVIHEKIYLRDMRDKLIAGAEVDINTPCPTLDSVRYNTDDGSMVLI